MNAIIEMGLSIAKVDEVLLSEEFIDVDFNGAMMVRFEKSEDGKWFAVNAVDGWGTNCRAEVEGKEGIVYKALTPLLPNEKGEEIEYEEIYKTWYNTAFRKMTFPDWFKAQGFKITKEKI